MSENFLQDNLHHKEILTLSQAASFLSITPAALRAKVFRRQIPFSKSGGRIYFLRSSLMDWIQGNEILSVDQVHQKAEEHIAQRKNISSLQNPKAM
jgi:hypothetical protein